jgi:hypothetical protein
VKGCHLFGKIETACRQNPQTPLLDTLKYFTFVIGCWIHGLLFKISFINPFFLPKDLQKALRLSLSAFLFSRFNKFDFNIVCTCKFVQLNKSILALLVQDVERPKLCVQSFFNSQNGTTLPG